MEEEVYFQLQGRRKKQQPRHIIARIIRDYSNHDYDSLLDLTYRYGLKIEEIKEVIELVLPSNIVDPVTISIWSKV